MWRRGFSLGGINLGRTPESGVRLGAHALARFAAGFLLVSTAAVSHAQTDPAPLVAPGNIAGNQLGLALSTDGDVILAGAPATQLSGFLRYSEVDQQTQEPITPGQRPIVRKSGGMAVFRRGSDGWDLDQYIPAPFGNDPQTEQGLTVGAVFGNGVAVSGDQILVGSPGNWLVRYQKDVDCPYVRDYQAYLCNISSYGTVGEVLTYEYDASRPEGERWFYSQLLAPPGNFNYFGQLNDIGRATVPRPRCNPAPPFHPLGCNYSAGFLGNYTPGQYFGTAVAMGNKYAAISAPGPLNPAGGRTGFKSYPIRIYWHGSDASDECASLNDPYALPPKPPPPLGAECWHVVQTSTGNPWTISEVQPRAAFGASLAISSDGNFLVVGAPYACNGTPQGQGRRCSPETGLSAGAVYVYEHNGQPGILGGYGPTPVATLLPQDPGPGDLFGASVAIDGDRIAVGANLKDCTAFLPRSPPYALQIGPEFLWGRGCEPDESGVAAGAVYVFSHDGSGNWSEEGVFQVPGSNLYTGTSVALRGDDLYAGAPGFSGDRFYEGAVVHFRYANGAWNYLRTLTPPQSLQQGKFGNAVAAAGTTLAVGTPTTTPGETQSLGSEEGRVFAFTDGLSPKASSTTSELYSLKGYERMKIWSTCRRGRDRITADFELSDDGRWQVSTSPGYVFGGPTEAIGRSGRKFFLRFDEESFAQYETSIVEWSGELCQAPVTEVANFTRSKFSAKLNKRRTGIRVKLKTSAIGATSLGIKKAKHLLAGKGRAQ